MKAIILEGHDRTPQAPAGSNSVARLKLIQHRLPFFLAALLGHDQQKVKNGENEDERRHTQPPHTTATTTELYCQQKLHI